VREELTTLGEQGVFLFRAKGDGTFEDVTARAGVRWAGAGPAGAEWVDYNHDGRLDLYVANGLWSGGPENIESLFARVVDDRATRHLGLTPHEGTNETTIPDLLMSLPADAQRHPNPMLSVLREYRGRGVAKFLLRDAFHRDAGLGFTGTALHCDATNPTGATQLYESVGMQRDQYYLAWRAGLPVFVASRPRG